MNELYWPDSCLFSIAVEFNILASSQQFSFAITQRAIRAPPGIKTFMSLYDIFGQWFTTFDRRGWQAKEDVTHLFLLFNRMSAWVFLHTFQDHIVGDNNVLHLCGMLPLAKCLPSYYLVSSSHLTGKVGDIKFFLQMSRIGHAEVDLPEIQSGKEQNNEQPILLTPNPKWFPDETQMGFLWNVCM